GAGRRSRAKLSRSALKSGCACVRAGFRWTGAGLNDLGRGVWDDARGANGAEVQGLTRGVDGPDVDGEDLGAEGTHAGRRRKGALNRDSDHTKGAREGEGEGGPPGAVNNKGAGEARGERREGLD